MNLLARIALLLIISANFLFADKPLIAVFPVKPDRDVRAAKLFTPSELEQLTSMIRSESSRILGQDAEILSDATIQKMTTANLAECSGSSCLAGFLQTISADYGIQPNLRIVFGKLVLTLEVASNRKVLGAPEESTKPNDAGKNQIAEKAKGLAKDAIGLIQSEIILDRPGIGFLGTTKGGSSDGVMAGPKAVDSFPIGGDSVHIVKALLARVPVDAQSALRAGDSIAALVQGYQIMESKSQLKTLLPAMKLAAKSMQWYAQALNIANPLVPDSIGWNAWVYFRMGRLNMSLSEIHRSLPLEQSDPMDRLVELLDENGRLVDEYGAQKDLLDKLVILEKKRLGFAALAKVAESSYMEVFYWDCHATWTIATALQKQTAHTRTQELTEGELDETTVSDEVKETIQNAQEQVKAKYQAALKESDKFGIKNTWVDKIRQEMGIL